MVVLRTPENQTTIMGRHLWNPSYFVVTVSERSLQQVLTYIEEQKVR